MMGGFLSAPTADGNVGSQLSLFTSRTDKRMIMYGGVRYDKEKKVPQTASGPSINVKQRLLRVRRARARHRNGPTQARLFRSRRISRGFLHRPATFYRLACASSSSFRLFHLLIALKFVFGRL